MEESCKICKCGHKDFYHINNILRGIKFSRCRVNNCKCKKFIEKPNSEEEEK